MPDLRAGRRAAAVLASAVVLATTGNAGIAEDLAGSEWVPVEIGGEAAAVGTRAFVQFGAEGRLSGSSGCNRFTGTYEVDGATLRVGRGLAMTRMGCPPATMEEEARFLSALEAVRAFTRDGIALDLTGADGGTVLRLRQTDWD